MRYHNYESHPKSKATIQSGEEQRSSQLAVCSRSPYWLVHPWPVLLSMIAIASPQPADGTVSIQKPVTFSKMTSTQNGNMLCSVGI